MSPHVTAVSSTRICFFVPGYSREILGAESAAMYVLAKFNV